MHNLVLRFRNPYTHPATIICALRDRRARSIRLAPATRRTARENQNTWCASRGLPSQASLSRSGTVSSRAARLANKAHSTQACLMRAGWSARQKKGVGPPTRSATRLRRHRSQTQGRSRPARLRRRLQLVAVPLALRLARRVRRPRAGPPPVVARRAADARADAQQRLGRALVRQRRLRRAVAQPAGLGTPEVQ